MRNIKFVPLNAKYPEIPLEKVEKLCLTLRGHVPVFFGVGDVQAEIHGGSMCAVSFGEDRVYSLVLEDL